MKAETREDLETYYRDASSWAEDRAKADMRSTRLAWIVAGMAIIVALAEAVALVALTPLKTVVPYTLMVDRQTGYVQALKPLELESVSADTALTQSFLVQYVLAREGFDRAVVKHNYQKVASWSNGRNRATYIASMQASNPQSPFARYGTGTTIETRVKSVSPLDKNNALVRYDIVQHDPNGRIGEPQPWIANISYTYSGEPMSVEDRFMNPLGFKVIKYRKDPEALSRVAVDPPSPITVAAPTAARAQPVVQGPVDGRRVP